jgi:hypothetical protein
MVLSKAKKRAAFQPGSLVIVKKSNLKGKIIDTIGRKKWKVELTLDGQTTVADYTSQQLRHPKDHELQDVSSNTSNVSNVRSLATSDEQTGVQTGVEPVLVNTTVTHEDPDSEEEEDHDILSFTDVPCDIMDVPCDHDDANERANLQDSDDSDDSDDDIPPRHHDDSDDDADALPRPPSPAYESNNEEEEDPDEDLSEDLPSRNTVTGDADGTEADISDASFAAQLEPEDDKYRRKQEFYKLDKQKLIDDKWTVKKKPSKQTKIAIGATVQERSGAKRSGLIVDVGSEDLTWMVRFERSENDEQLPSSRLKLVQDNSEYVWTIVKDSSPEQNKAVTEYRDIGLMGIHFGEDFSDTSSSNKDYDYPYLRLLQTLWPGKFKHVQ